MGPPVSCAGALRLLPCPVRWSLGGRLLGCFSSRFLPFSPELGLDPRVQLLGLEPLALLFLAELARPGVLVSQVVVAGVGRGVGKRVLVKVLNGFSV